jgi:hypothetical protein
VHATFLAAFDIDVQIMSGAGRFGAVNAALARIFVDIAMFDITRA